MNYVPSNIRYVNGKIFIIFWCDCKKEVVNFRKPPMAKRARAAVGEERAGAPHAAALQAHPRLAPHARFSRTPLTLASHPGYAIVDGSGQHGGLKEGVQAWHVGLASHALTARFDKQPGASEDAIDVSFNLHLHVNFNVSSMSTLMSTSMST